MAQDFYDILGVSKGASEDEIKKAFRKKAHEHHPDKASGDEAKFKEINEAYQTLSNKEKRAQYDQFGQTFNGAGGGSSRGSGGFGGGGGGAQGFEFNFGDAGGGFGDMFGDMFGGGRSSGRGRDIQVGLTITFDDVVNGTKKDVTLRKSVACSHCAGSGGEPGSAEKTCATCGGHGSVEKVMQTMLGNFAQRVPCDTCDGRGKTFEKTCTVCRGAGNETKEVKETIDVPAGIQAGQTISFGGRGEAGEHGAPAGDLLVTIDVTNDKRFKREGNNINSDVHVSFAQAALGDKVSVETVDGKVKMKVPAGTQSGEIFRIRNKGVPRLQGIGRGDHMVTVIVDIPTKLSREQKKLVQELEKLS